MFDMKLWPCCLFLPAALTPVIVAAAAEAQESAGPRLLFIRGADRSGGFYEAISDGQRTEHLSDVTNDTTGANNHSWGHLATTLENAGFVVEQMIEPLAGGDPVTGQTSGAPIAFESMDLSGYDALVFGSNNAAYGTAQADAVEAYLRAGGAAVFISDANFGSDWGDASDSDQAFLDRLGLVANQDNGTYSISRAAGEFLNPDHPLLDGVNSIDGEGVTPVTVLETLPDGVTVEILARHEGSIRRNDNDSGNQLGNLDGTPAANDAALVVGTIDAGRFAWAFDRNTFFNDNGQGTDITRLDNAAFAVNLFEHVTSPVPEPTTALIAALGLAALTLRRRA